MGTQLAEKEEASELKERRAGPATTTVRVTPETKEGLDRLLEVRGAASFDDVIYELMREHLQPELGLNLPPRASNIRDVAARLAQVEEALRRLEVDLLVTDPKTGIVFNPIRGAKVKRRVKGDVPKRAHLLEGKWVPDDEEGGIHVQLSEDLGWPATEAHGDLPPAVIEHVKMEGKKEKDRAPIAPRGRYFREPPAPPAPPAPTKGAGKKGGDAS